MRNRAATKGEVLSTDSSAIEEPLFEEPTDEGEEETAAQIDEYDLTSSPNDFNVSTIFNFIGSGSVKIPAFQRNYVWDVKRASRLIESLIIGLPVPQIFLYEEARNSFLVVDGQQRLMTIYYFMRGRFPKWAKRAELRKIFDEHGSIPDDIFNSNDYFEQFRLKLPAIGEETPNKFTGLTYETLNDYKTQFDLRTIRNIIVKQVKPSADHSSIYEMFNRLNTGGTLLSPQEIRVSLYHSKLLDLLATINVDQRWQDLTRRAQPDLHMRDVELLLRATAMWRTGPTYNPSMATFLNKFAAHAQQRFDQDDLDKVRDVFDWFLGSLTDELAGDLRTDRNKLITTLFESVFAACAERWEAEGAFDIPQNFITTLAVDGEFRGASDTRPTDRRNVRNRLARAKEVLREQPAEV